MVESSSSLHRMKTSQSRRIPVIAPQITLLCAPHHPAVAFAVARWKESRPFRPSPLPLSAGDITATVKLYPQIMKLS